MRTRFFATVIGFALLSGCSSVKDLPLPKIGSQSETDEQMFLTDTIEKNYDPHVIMKRAESFFEQKAYPEAIVEYQHFLDMHRKHVLAPYSQYRLAESHLKMAKSVDRDPAPVEKAREGFEQLLKDYPGSKYEMDALEKIRECQNWLAEVNFFVGQFYYRRGAYLAAAHRFEAILQDDPDLEVAPDALYYLALTYKEIGAEDWAREKLVMLTRQYPHHKHQKETQKLYAELNGEPPEVSYAQLFPDSSKDESPSSALSFGVAGQTDSVPDALEPFGGVPNTFTSPPRTMTPASMSRGASAPPPQAGDKACRLGTWC